MKTTDDKDGRGPRDENHGGPPREPATNDETVATGAGTLMLTADQVARLVGVSRQAVHQAARKGKFGNVATGPKGEMLIPEPLAQAYRREVERRRGYRPGRGSGGAGGVSGDDAHGLAVRPPAARARIGKFGLQGLPVEALAGVDPVLRAKLTELLQAETDRRVSEAATNRTLAQIHEKQAARDLARMDAQAAGAARPGNVNVVRQFFGTWIDRANYSTDQRDRLRALAGEVLLAIDDLSMAALAARPMTFVETMKEADRAHTQWCTEVGIAGVGRPDSDAQFVQMWVEEVRKRCARAAE